MSEQFERENPEVLSPAGRARRDQILRDAIHIAGRRRRAKFVARAALVAVGFGIVSWVFVLDRKPAPAPIVRVDQPVIREMTPPPKKPSAEIVIVQVKTDPSLLEQLRVPPQKPTWQELSDDELLKQLAAAGKPAGIAYVGGKPELLYR